MGIINVGITGGHRMLTATILASLESSASIYTHVIRDNEFRPIDIDNYVRAGMPQLPIQQTYVPKLNRKSKLWELDY